MGGWVSHVTREVLILFAAFGFAITVALVFGFVRARWP
jgi:hypothetical protein